ncbi:MAG: CO dehydrogenase/CO-methylating acetyl-CoA synthase complex subunit beta [Candidatus Bathyarchaeia archaeon]
MTDEPITAAERDAKMFGETTALGEEHAAKLLEEAKAAEKFPVDIGIQYSGERIRAPETYVSLGGDGVPYKFELVQVKPINEVEDESVVVVGPDLQQMQEGGKYPIGILVKVAGANVEKDQEGVIERRIHECTSFIEGMMHLNQRNTIFLRVSKKAYRKGLNSLKIYGRILIKLLKAQLPFLEKIQVTILTDEEKVKEGLAKAKEVYRERDDRARALSDEEAPEFYSCLLCQSFAPNNVCVITPDRFSPCGATSWFDAKVACQIDPKGPNTRIEKGRCLDPIAGEWEGVNKFAYERSNQTISRVFLHSAFDYPHTVCGCFESIVFYIPEVDGMGIVPRDFKEVCVNGLTFSSMANVTGGGVQSPGFIGVSTGYLRSRKFIQRDGGWDRVVWMPSILKDRLKDFPDDIPPNKLEKIATEKDANNIDALKEFLTKVSHPVVERWKEKVTPLVVEAKEAVKVPELEVPTQVIVGAPAEVAGGGFKVILKNVTIVAEKLIVKKANGK